MRTLLRRAPAALCSLLLTLHAVAGSAAPGSMASPPAGFPSAAQEASSVAGGGFRWPLAGVPRLVRRFDPPPQPWLPGHRGVDLAAGAGAEVRSAGPGVVLFAGMVAGRPVVTVGHSDGLRTTYEPVRPGLTVGTRVAAGTPVGILLAGHPGCPAAACLHWGLRRGEEYLDPLALLGLGTVRLLPVGGSPVPTPEPGRPGGGPSPLAVPPDQLDHRPAQSWASSGGSRIARRSYSSGVL